MSQRNEDGVMGERKNTFLQEGKERKGGEEEGRGEVSAPEGDGRRYSGNTFRLINKRVHVSSAHL